MIFSERSFYGPYDDLAYSDALAAYGRAVGTLFLSDQHGQESWAENLSTPPRNDDGIRPGAPGIPSFTSYAQFPVTEIAQSYVALANVQVSADTDGIFRRVPPVRFFDGYQIPSMALAMYRAGGAGSGELSVRPGERGLFLDGRRLPVDREGNLTLRFRGDSGTHPTYTAASVIRSQIQILSGEDPQISPEHFFDKYVLFGFSAPGLLDQRASPMSETYAGVEIHATMLDNLLSGDFRIPVPVYGGIWTAVLILLVISHAFASSFAATAVSGAWKSIAVYAAFFIGVPALAALAWYGPVAMPVVPFIAVAILSLGGAGIVNYATEGRQKRFIKGAFGQYLSPDVINQLLKDPGRLKLGGERRDITIFFSDLEGFTTISEGLEPEELTSLLNEYLTAMAAVIKNEGGTIDKYEGDAIIAFWNAPLNQSDHAVRGIRAALGCQEALENLRPRLSAMAGGKPVKMRIGMNTGPAVVGNMGSVDRFDYTMFGDAVNLAARLEGVNKQFGTYTMISEATLQAARQRGVDFAARELARVEVVGKAEAVTVYEPFDPEASTPTALKDPALLKSFAEALAAFYDGRFIEARGLFAALASRDPAAAKYLAKLETLGDTPPPDWAGVWVMTSK